jgi:hypothetical protein
VGQRLLLDDARVRLRVLTRRRAIRRWFLSSWVRSSWAFMMITWYISTPSRRGSQIGLCQLLPRHGLPLYNIYGMRTICSPSVDEN